MIRTMVVDKRKVTEPRMGDRVVFYDYLVQCLLQNDGGVMADARLILDQRDKGKKNQQSLGTYLRRELNSSPTMRRIVGVRYHESHRDNLLQAVDMASGAIYAHYARRKTEYLRIIRPKISDIWEF